VPPAGIKHNTLYDGLILFGKAVLNGIVNIGADSSAEYKLSVIAADNTAAAAFFWGTNYGAVAATQSVSASHYAFMVASGASAVGTGGTVRFFVRADGNVGIGTSSPTSKLSVVGLVTYADQAAAVASGKTTGDFYKLADGTVKVIT